MLNCIIVDDNQEAINVIKKYVERTNGLRLIDTFTDPVKGLSFLNDAEVDLIFLDQEMPDLSGIDFVNLMQEINGSIPSVIFTSGHTECAVSTYDFVQVVGFLEKPVAYEKFVRSIQKINKLRSINIAKDIVDKNFIMVETTINKRKVSHRIDLDDIIYLECTDNFVTFHSENPDSNLIAIRMSMTEIEHKLPSTRFIRIQRNYLINFSKLQKIHHGRQHMKVELLNKQTLPVGRLFFQNLLTISERHTYRDKN